MPRRGGRPDIVRRMCASTSTPRGMKSAPGSIGNNDFGLGAWDIPNVGFFPMHNVAAILEVTSREDQRGTRGGTLSLTAYRKQSNRLSYRLSSQMVQWMTSMASFQNLASALPREFQATPWWPSLVERCFPAARRFAGDADDAPGRFLPEMVESARLDPERAIPLPASVPFL